MRILFKIIKFSKEKFILLMSRFVLKVQTLVYNITISKPYNAYGIPLMETFRDGKIIIGRDFRFNSGRHFNKIGRNQQLLFQVWGLLKIGDHVRMSGTAIVCKKEIIIENHVMIGGNVVIYDTDFHSLNSEERNMIPEDRTHVKTLPVKIGYGAFIGGHSTILKGVTIGSRAIVGAGSVVTKDIPPGEVWAGNPARFIRKV